MDQATILVVEDNPTLRLLYKHQLTLAGHNVLVAETTKEAYHLLQLNKVQLILLDILLPDKNGLVFLEELRKELQFATIPVLLLTSLPEEIAYEKGKALGIYGYLVKDQVTPEQIAQRVKLTLDEIGQKSLSTPTQ